MKTPLCSICLKSDFLCSGCSQKLLKGELTKSIIDISRTLFKLSEEIPSLKTVVIHEIIPTSNSIVILTEGGDGAKVVGKNGKIVKLLAKKTGKSIRIVEKSPKFEEIVKSLDFPVKLLGVNTLFSKDGEKKKIVISQKDKGRIPFNDVSFRAIVKKLTNQEVVLFFK